MERIVSPEEASSLLEHYCSTWTQMGWQVGPITWRDAAEAWPQELKTERAGVMDPDSIGVEVERSNTAVAQIVLFRGGWADVTYGDLRVGELEMSAPKVTTAHEFSTLLQEITEHLRSA